MKRRLMISALLVLAGLLGLAYVWWDLTRVYGWGIGVDEVEWLPASSSNITYFEDAFIRSAEFDINREAYLRWSEEQERAMEPLAAGGAEAVFRPNVYLANNGKIESRELRGKVTEEELNKFRDWQQANLEGGDLFYAEDRPNGGGYRLGYDQETGRGYYWRAHH